MARAAYNARKAAQVIAFFIEKNGAELEVIKAVKLVYLADRLSLEQYGFPVLDEPHCAMPHGPVNSDTYSHINGEEDLDACGWSEFLEDRANHKVAARRHFDTDDLDELSEADIECLEAVWERFGHMGKWEIRDWTHVRKNVPEWEDPNGSSRVIPLERIMTTLGIDNADIQAETVKDHRRIDELFASLRG